MAVSWIVVLILFRETVMSMVEVWQRSDTFSHGFMIFPISLYLIWRQRHRVALLQPTPNFWGILLLAVVGFIWLFGNLANVLVVQQLALVAMLQGLVLAVLGSRVTYALIFPLTILYFAVPAGEILVPALTDFTAFSTVTALRITGIPVLWEGRFIFTPTGTWEVAKACSGLRYVIPAVVLGCLFSYITYRSSIRRLVFILACLVASIVANNIRAYGIIMLAHFSNNRIAVGVDHLVYGWFFFIVVMLLLFLPGLYWRETPAAGSSDTELHPPLSGEKQVSAMNSKPDHVRPALPVVLTAVIGVFILSFAPASARMLMNSYRTSHAIHPVDLSTRPPWKPQVRNSGDWLPHFNGADVEVTGRYTSGDRHVHLYIAYYADQQQGAELINSENKIVDDMRWIRISDGHTRAIVDGKVLRLHETITRSSFDEKRLVWSWYWVADEFTSSPYYAKFLQAKTRLFREPQEAAVLAISAEIIDERSEAADILQDFLLHCGSLHETLSNFSQ